MLFVELAKAEDDWLWHNDIIGNKRELEFGCFGRLVMEKVKGKMGSIGGRGHYMVWLTSLDDDCCEGCLESCSIFHLDSRNMGQSFVRWLVSLP
jgi:hypothetical protein